MSAGPSRSFRADSLRSERSHNFCCFGGDDAECRTDLPSDFCEHSFLLFRHLTLLRFLTADAS